MDEFLDVKHCERFNVPEELKSNVLTMIITHPDACLTGFRDVLRVIHLMQDIEFSMRNGESAEEKRRNLDELLRGV